MHMHKVCALTIQRDKAVQWEHSAAVPALPSPFWPALGQHPDPVEGPLNKALYCNGSHLYLVPIATAASAINPLLP